MRNSHLGAQLFQAGPWVIFHFFLSTPDDTCTNYSPLFDQCKTPTFLGGGLILQNSSYLFSVAVPPTTLPGIRSTAHHAQRYVDACFTLFMTLSISEFKGELISV